MPSSYVRWAASRVRGAGRDATMLARLTRDLPPYVRQPLTLDEACDRIRQQLETRQERFLATADHGIFRHPTSPYLQLLRHAGCERGDLRALVAAEGIEGALRQLAHQGVYVTFDEFKGRRPIVRGSARFEVTDRDFDSPSDRWHYFEVTGGSRGRPVRVGRTLPYVTEIAASFALVLEAHGISRAHNLFWFGGTPTWALIYLKLGHAIDGWMYPVRPLPREAEAGIQYMRLLVRAAGRSMPGPTYCDVQEPERIIHWISEHQRDGRPVVLNTTSSSAVRVAATAKAMGRTLDGVILHCRSEPLTQPRRDQIDRSGARTLADYASVELSIIGFACPSGSSADDLHVGLNRHAVIERTRPIFEGGPEVDALLVTTLAMNAPKIALNVELGDSARIEQRECGCLLSAAGFRTHISAIRSFEKLSTEGTSFARDSILRILEDVLPRQFGGTAIDYQVVEEEAPDGSSLLVLRVHPSVGAIDEAAVRSALLIELGRGGPVEEYHARLIRRAESIIVQRLPPLATSAGKVLPFHLQRVSARTTSAPTPGNSH